MGGHTVEQYHTSEKDGLFINSQEQGEHSGLPGSRCLFPAVGESLGRVTDRATSRRKRSVSSAPLRGQGVGGKKMKMVAGSGEAVIHWGANFGQIMVALVLVLKVFQMVANTMARTEAAIATEVVKIYHWAREELQKKVDEINSLDPSDENYATKANIRQTEYSEKNQEFQNLENRWQSVEQSQGTAEQNIANSSQEAAQETTSVTQPMRVVATLLQTAL